MNTILKDNKTDINTFIEMQMNCLYRGFKLMQNQLSTGFNLMVPILIMERFKTLIHVYFIFALEFCSLLLKIFYYLLQPLPLATDMVSPQTGI